MALGDGPLSPHIERYLAHLTAVAIEHSAVPPEELVTLMTADVGQTPSDVIYEENTLELHRYDPEEQVHETPILVVYALVNRPYILDLQPDRSVVQELLDAGFSVYLVDWGEPTLLDTSLGLDDYVCRYVDNCVDAVCADAGVDRTHLLGYCMGGTLATMYTTQFQDRVETLSLMATPIVVDDSGGILEDWVEYYDPAVPAATYGNVPAWLLAVQFAMMEPVENLVAKYVNFLENVDDESFVEMFARMERWTWDGVDVAGRVFVEFIEDIYRENHLIDGEVALDGDPVDPADIEVPVLQIVGEYDHIVPPASSAPLNDAVGTDDERFIEFPAGHIGISVSGGAHADLWPTVCAWLAERSPE
jgi:polyhydroxyalkanoate synthase